MFVFLSRLGDLPGDDEVSVVDIDVDFVLGQARKLEGGRHEVLIRILMEVHPKASIVSVEVAKCGRWGSDNYLGFSIPVLCWFS